MHINHAPGSPGRRAITAIHQIEGFRNLLRSKLKTPARGISRHAGKTCRRATHRAAPLPVDAPAKSARRFRADN